MNFPPYITPTGEARTQTHTGKAATLAMVDLIINRECKRLITATTKAEANTSNRRSTAKRMCFIGGVTFATELADSQLACGQAKVCHLPVLSQKRTQAARGMELTTTRDSLCASSDVAITFPDRSLSTSRVYQRMLHRVGNGGHVELCSVTARFDGVAEVDATMLVNEAGVRTRKKHITQRVGVTPPPSIPYLLVNLKSIT